MNKYIEIAKEVGQLVEEKNKAYGSAFQKSTAFLKLLYPNGIPIEKYPDVLLQVRIFDKLVRLANDSDYNNESPYIDISGYGLLGEEMRRQDQHA